MDLIEYLLIISVLAISELGFFLAGYALGKFEKKSQITQKLSKNISKWETPSINKIDDPGYVGAIQRPTAKDLAKWNENPKTKEEKDAISESLYQDPELVRMKKLREDYIKSTNVI